MTKITVDPPLAERLLRLTGRVELCDTSGRTLGYFTPVAVPIDPRLRVPQVSEEELARRLRQETGRPIEDILADLELRVRRKLISWRSPMTKITVDAPLLERLGFLSERVELCDETGRTLAYVTPVSETIDPRLLVPQVSEEELDRRERAGGGRPLADILADLERLK